MADFSRYIPEPVKDLDQLAALLRFWNEEICIKEQQGKSYIYSVVLGTEEVDEKEDKERNVVWFKDSTAQPLAPARLAEFAITLDPNERRRAIMGLEDSEKVELRSAAMVLFANGERKWVALFDPAPSTQGSPGDAPVIAPLITGTVGAITPDHWLTGAQRVPIGNGTAFVPRFVVMHYTEGYLAESSISGWKDRNDGILAHVVVDRDGRIFQCRPFNETCQHAGPSRTRDPKTNKLYNGLNSCSIGIEIANTGMKTNLHARLGRGGPYPEGTTMKADHRNGGKGSSEARDGKEWEIYPEAQQRAVFDLVSLLVAKYHLQDITGHDCIAPERKADPGPAFPMKALREANGFSGLPKVWDERGVEIHV